MAGWLFVCCGLIFLMVVVGGITRLTLSGLSITEWNPVIGVIPPLTHAQWAAEFARYQQVPEYRALHYGMSLADFKSLYFWEYAHRLLGRLIGVVFAVPLVWFWVRGRLPRRLAPALLGILALGFAQGLLGWYMVESGLVHRVEVSQYRLVAHLLLALAIYSAILWTALGLAYPSRPFRGAEEGHGPKGCEGEVGEATFGFIGPPHPALSRRQKGEEGSAGDGRGRSDVRYAASWVSISPSWRRVAEAVILLVALTIAAGGFVAGTRAGFIYNTFPLMGGNLAPDGIRPPSSLCPQLVRERRGDPVQSPRAGDDDHRRGAAAMGCRPAPPPAALRHAPRSGTACRRRAASRARHLDLALGRADPARRRPSGRRRIAADRRDRLSPHCATWRS